MLVRMIINNPDHSDDDKKPDHSHDAKKEQLKPKKNIRTAKMRILLDRVGEE